MVLTSSSKTPHNQGGRVHFYAPKNQMTKRITALMVTCTLFIPVEFTLMSSASAARTGSVCKKLNSKGWDGNKPIVCKKNKSGKLMWTKFKTAPENAPKTATAKYKLKVSVEKYKQVSLDFGALTTSEQQLFCAEGGFTAQDISASTRVEIRNGAGNLIATANLGSATITPYEGESYTEWGNCLFVIELKLIKSDFYQIKIGTRYNESFSFADLENTYEWQIELGLES